MTVITKSPRGITTADVLGPVCESRDCFTKDRQLQEAGEGELVALMSAGADCYVTASRYSGRGLSLWCFKDSRFELVNPRETIEQVIAREHIPSFLG